MHNANYLYNINDIISEDDRYKNNSIIIDNVSDLIEIRFEY